MGGLLLSATLSKEIIAISRTFSSNPERIDVAPEQVVAATVVHRVYAVPQEQKRDVLAHLLTTGPARQTLVFCRTKHGSDRVGRFLEGGSEGLGNYFLLGIGRDLHHSPPGIGSPKGAIRLDFRMG